MPAAGRVDDIDPAGVRVRKGVRIRHIRLDVEYRRAVEQIDATHAQATVFDHQQLHRRQTDRIRAMRRSRRQHAAFAAAARRLHFRLPTLAAVKREQQPDALESGQITKEGVCLFSWKGQKPV